MTNYTERIEFLVNIHTTNPELNHQVGKDSYCMYCDEYKKLLYKINNDKNATDTYLNMGIKKVYFVELEDESKFLTLVHHPERIEKMLKKEDSAIKSINKIPQKYWQTYYIENEFGELIAMDSLLRLNKRVRVLAKKGESINHKQKGYVTPKTPLPYFVYTENSVNELENFISPEIIETDSNGCLSLKTPLGSQKLEYGQVLLKLSPGILIIYNQKDFFNNFESDEEMVWKTYFYN